MQAADIDTEHRNCGDPDRPDYPVSDMSQAIEADRPSTAVYGVPPTEPAPESADGSAADESLLGPSPGSVVAP